MFLSYICDQLCKLSIPLNRAKERRDGFDPNQKPAAAAGGEDGEGEEKDEESEAPRRGSKGGDHGPKGAPAHAAGGYRAVAPGMDTNAIFLFLHFLKLGSCTVKNFPRG